METKLQENEINSYFCISPSNQFYDIQIVTYSVDFLCIRNIKMNILACFYCYCTSQLFEICKQKQNTSILEILIGWRIIWYYYSCFIPLKWKFSTMHLIYGFMLIGTWTGILESKVATFENIGILVFWTVNIFS